MANTTLEEINSRREERSGAADIFPNVRPLTDEIRIEIIKAIESHMLNLAKEIAAGNSPTLSSLAGPSSRQAGSQVLTRFSVKASRRKMALLVYTLSKIHRLLITNSKCSRREFFYERVDLFQSQRQVDETAKHACQLLQRPPWHLCLTATSKGLVAGDLIIVTDDGHRLNCNAEPTGTLVPKNVLGILSLETSARFILVVEKDTVFQKLIKEDWPRRLGHCLLVTGKGYPDVDTRLLLWRLDNELKVPLMALVDADPHGIDIMCTYRFGPSKSSSLLTAPPLTSLCWLGLHPTDISPLGLPTTPLTSEDRRLAVSLLRRAENISDIQCAESITRQVQELLSSGKKAEIESLAKCAANFLTDVYIPRKMSNSEYV